MGARGVHLIPSDFNQFLCFHPRWETQSHRASPLLHGHLRTGLGLGHFLSKRQSPYSLCRAHHLSLLQTQRVLVALLQRRCQWPSGMAPAFCISDPVGGVRVLPLQHQVGCIPASEWTHWPRGANALQGTGSCALSLLLCCCKETRYHVSLGCCCLFSATSLISSLGDIIIK